MEALKNGTFTAFEEHRLLCRGEIVAVARACKAAMDRPPEGRIALFEDATGEVIDLDYRGTDDEFVSRLAEHPLLKAAEPRQRSGPGRPKLGVVCREISLLPRHWEWLATQRGGASAAIRRLVDEARKLSGEDEGQLRVRDAAHRFMWDLAGDLPGFEEASRAFYAGRFDDLEELVAKWPADVAAHTLRLVAPLR